MTEVNTVDDLETLTAQPVLTDAEREARKPDISRLPNALDENGFPRFRVGEKIIVERRSVVLQGSPYLDTKTYLVMGIDTESGKLDLFDDNLAQSALSNYIDGPKRGFVFKLAKGNAVSTKRKRGRPRKNPIVDETVTKEAAAPTEKKKRGRPPGSKNRSREEIKAEKKAKLAEREERKAKRKTKRK